MAASLPICLCIAASLVGVNAGGHEAKTCTSSRDCASDETCCNWQNSDGKMGESGTCGQMCISGSFEATSANYVPPKGMPTCMCTGELDMAIPRVDCDEAPEISPSKKCVLADETYGDISSWRKYPDDYGAECKMHVEPAQSACFDNNPALAVPKQLENPTAAWCTKPWCYVDPSKCDSPDMGDSSVFSSYGTLKYSYDTCNAIEAPNFAVTCAHAKAAYKMNECCGNPAAKFDENHLFPEPKQDCVGYGMKMEILGDDKVAGMGAASDDCFYPVTIQALLDAGEEHYTYLGQSHTNAHAPDGAFVYKMAGGGLRYKKVVIQDTCEGADLCFSCDHTLGRLTTFEEAKMMSKAMTCSSDVITVDALKDSYSHYAWVQFPGQTCGSFIYQKTHGMPLVHKTCG